MQSKRWFKGSLHTHTNETDGDTDPRSVCEWYGGHGYDFLVLSDHNRLTTLEPSAEEQERWPFLIPGEEVTLVLGEVPVHLNGIGLKKQIGMERYVEPELARTVPETLQVAVDRIRDAGGLVQINHPNYKWAFDDRAMRQVNGASLLEVFNGHPITNSPGGGGTPGAESMWDRLLTTGHRIWGVATDDAHHLQGEFAPTRGNPGRGWVMVRAGDLSEEEIVEALGNGEFYASTGVSLAEVSANGRSLEIEIEPAGDIRYTTIFAGDGGRELWRSHGESVDYAISRLDTFVRATVYASNGARAWTQPLFTSDG